MKLKLLHILLLVTLLVTCLPTGQAEAQASHSIRVGLLSPLERLDPLFAGPAGLTQSPGQLTNAETLVHEQLFLGLTGLNEQGEPFGELATSWDISEDAATWTFYLRPGVQWVDSRYTPQREVLAQDVVFAIRRSLEFGAFGGLIAGVEAVDDRTVTFKLTSSYLDFATLMALPSAKPQPADLVDKYREAWTQPDVIWTNGPYLLTGWFKGQAHLAANPYWWDAKLLQVQSARLEAGLNPEAALRRYRGGDLDLIELTTEQAQLVSQEAALAPELRTVGSPQRLTFAPTNLAAVQQSRLFFYLVKPHVQPTYSPIFGLDGFERWTLTWSDPGIVIPETTRILDDETLNALQAMSTDQAVLTFARQTPQLSVLQIGDILVGNSTLGRANEAVAPFGFLRRVLSTVLNADGTFTVQTAQATLDEAITRGNQSLSLTLQLGNVYREENLTTSALPQRSQFALVSYVPPQSEFRVAIDHVVYDADQDPATDYDQVRAKGWVRLEPNMNLNLSFQVVDHELQSLYFSQTAVESSHIELSSKVDLLDYKQVIPIKRFIFVPQVVFIGPLPVVITPELTIKVGLNGNVSVGISAGIDQQATVTTGLQYAKPNWSTVLEIAPNEHMAPAVETQLTQSARAQAYAGPELAVNLYGVAGPYGQVHGYLKLEANPADSPWWTLKGGVEAELGMKVEVFSHVVASYKELIPITETVLAQAQTAPPADLPTPLPTVPPTVVSTPTPPIEEPACKSPWWPLGCWPAWLWVVAAAVILLFILALSGIL